MPQRADTTGQTLVANRYALGQRLGNGGMSHVYAAHDQLLDRDVAVKLFGPAVDAAGPERQRAEMRTLAQLSHPRLVALHDAGTDHVGDGWDRAYLVMELIDGPSLATVLHDGPLTPQHAARIGAGVADALDYIHSRGIIHRDVKPANILLDGPLDAGGEPRLADFGIAQTLGDGGLTQTGLTIGTAPYLSPEQVRGASAGPASDIYALGLVLLECLTGRREYPGSTAESALARLTRQPLIDPDLPQPWPELLAAMTGPDPQRRPPAAEVAQALEAGSYHIPASPARPAAQDTTILPTADVAPSSGNARDPGDSANARHPANAARTRLLTQTIPATPTPRPSPAPTAATTVAHSAAARPVPLRPSAPLTSSHQKLAVAGAGLLAALLLIATASALRGTDTGNGTGTTSGGASPGSGAARSGQPKPAGPVRLKQDLDQLRHLVQK